jgi:hypothetical protein
MLEKRQVFAVVSVIAIFVTTVLLISIVLAQRYTIQSTSIVSDSPPLPPRQRKINDPSFTDTGYIVPLQSNATGSIYSSVAYIRGTMQSWGNGKVTVLVGTKLREIFLEQKVNLRCMDEYVPNEKGQLVKTSSTWLDVSKLKYPGVLYTEEELKEKFKIDDDIVLITSVDQKENMKAYQVIGYGCKE